MTSLQVPNTLSTTMIYTTTITAPSTTNNDILTTIITINSASIHHTISSQFMITTTSSTVVTSAININQNTPSHSSIPTIVNGHTTTVLITDEAITLQVTSSSAMEHTITSDTQYIIVPSNVPTIGPPTNSVLVISVIIIVSVVTILSAGIIIVTVYCIIKNKKKFRKKEKEGEIIITTANISYIPTTTSIKDEQLYYSPIYDTNYQQLAIYHTSQLSIILMKKINHVFILVTLGFMMKIR